MCVLEPHDSADSAEEGQARKTWVMHDMVTGPGYVFDTLLKSRESHTLAIIF